MANKEELDELDLDVQQKPAGKKRLILYIALALLVLVLGGGAAAFFLLKGDAPAEEEAVADKPVAVREAHYLALDKLVVNFGQRAPVRFLQVNLQVMSYDPAALKAMETHMPVIRNDILLLLGGQTYEDVSTPEGKERLRGVILETVQRILDSHEKERKVEAVYFTEFIMQ